MQLPFSQEEWARTPEAVRAFVRQLIRRMRDSDTSPANELKAGSGGQTAETGHVPASESRVQSARETNNLVVFISDAPRSREAKLMYGLRAHGWSGILLHRDPPTFDPAPLFTQTFSYRTPQEALSLARRFAPRVYHLFSNWRFDTAEHVIGDKLGPVIFDDYDVMAGMVQPEIAQERHPGQLEKERYCLEHADGLTCRSLELQYVKRRLGYRFGGKRIFVPDGCYGTIIPQRRPQERPKVAYCGNLSPNGETNYLKAVAEKVEEAGIELHIFPSLQVKADKLRAELRRILPATAPVYVHDTLPYDGLLQELAKCHYGLHALTPEDEGIQQTYRIEKFEYASANKVFDYVDAGLYSFVHHGKFIRFLMKRYRLGEHVADPVAVISGLGVGESVSVPDSFLVGDIAKRLIAFYEETEYGWRKSEHQYAQASA